MPTLVVAHPRRPSAFAGLTPREREVAALIARGLRNAEIARELVISTATVKDHVHRILRKTGFTSRAAVAAAWN
jgi:DNA-binding NarL/FixJ family response regulator